MMGNRVGFSVCHPQELYPTIMNCSVKLQQDAPITDVL